MFCSNCGNKLPDDSIFCNKCGSKIIASVESVIQPPTAYERVTPLPLKNEFSEVNAPLDSQAPVQTADSDKPQRYKRYRIIGTLRLVAAGAWVLLAILQIYLLVTGENVNPLLIIWNAICVVVMIKLGIDLSRGKRVNRNYQLCCISLLFYGYQFIASDVYFLLFFIILEIAILIVSFMLLSMPEKAKRNTVLASIACAIFFIAVLLIHNQYMQTGIKKASTVTNNPLLLPKVIEPRPQSPLTPQPVSPSEQAIQELKERQYEYSEYFSAESTEDGWIPFIIELWLDTDSQYESSTTGRFILSMGMAGEINLNAQTQTNVIRKRNSVNTPEIDEMWMLTTVIGKYDRKEIRQIDNETYVLEGYISEAMVDAFLPTLENNNPDRVISKLDINPNIYFSYDYNSNAVKVLTLGYTTSGEAGYIDWFYDMKFVFDANPLLLSRSQSRYSRIFYPDEDETAFFEEPVQESETPNLPHSISMETILNISSATDEILRHYSSYNEYNDGAGFGQTMIITTNMTIKEFKFYEVQIDFENGESVYNFYRELYSLNEITPEKPFVLAGSLGAGSLNLRGISFIDEHNTTRFFYINESGMDGSLGLFEIQQSEINESLW